MTETDPKLVSRFVACYLLDKESGNTIEMFSELLLHLYPQEIVKFQRLNLKQRQEIHKNCMSFLKNQESWSSHIAFGRNVPLHTLDLAAYKAFESVSTSMPTPNINPPSYSK